MLYGNGKAVVAAAVDGDANVNDVRYYRRHCRASDVAIGTHFFFLLFLNINFPVLTATATELRVILI